MTPEHHRSFTEAIRSRLAGDADVLGLVGLGSTSGLPPAPDDFSDHDLFVITRPGTQERYRGALDWLPSSAGPVVLSFRETAHGVKALLGGGHLVEFAVFDPEELALARVNRYAVLLDKTDVTARLARVLEATIAASAGHPPDQAWHAGQLLTMLVAGAARAARGEHLSGHQLVRVAALGHLVTLLRAALPPGLATLDDLDPFRRLEQALPGAARELDQALRLPVVGAAWRLLGILRHHRPELVGSPVLAAVERALARAEAAPH
jgi:lincosamide nucleotidyltransferase B/F